MNFKNKKSAPDYVRLDSICFVAVRFGRNWSSCVGFKWFWNSLNGFSDGQSLPDSPTGLTGSGNQIHWASLRSLEPDDCQLADCCKLYQRIC